MVVFAVCLYVIFCIFVIFRATVPSLARDVPYGFELQHTSCFHTACSLSTHFCVPFSFGLATAENIHVIVLHTASNGAKPISVILPIPMDTHSRLLHMTRGFKVVVPFAWKRKCTLLIDATVIFRLEAAVSNPAILEACMRPERFAIIKRFLFHLEVFWFSELFCFCSKAIKFVATTLLVQYSWIIHDLLYQYCT